MVDPAAKLRLVSALLSFFCAAGTAEARTGSAQARLRECGAATCLVITGRRSDAHAPVSVAGREVAVSGGRLFSISLPLDTVREWSAPFARTIAVRTHEFGGGGSEEAVRLPIGLLGHTTELASLDVSAR